MIYFCATLIYFTFFLRDVNVNWATFLIDRAFFFLVVTNMILFEILEII